MNFLVGIILILSGILLIKYRYPMYYFTGDWGWAQKYLGSNGTVQAIILLGLLLIFIGVAFPLGAFDREASPEAITNTESIQNIRNSPR